MRDQEEVCSGHRDGSALGAGHHSVRWPGLSHPGLAVAQLHYFRSFPDLFRFHIVSDV